jgi:hypothetical protein
MPEEFTNPAGASSATMNVVAIDNVTNASPQYVTVNLSTDAAYAVGSPASARVDITTVSSTPTVTVTATDANATIGTSDNAVVTFTRTGGSNAADLTVQYNFGGNAATWDDYRRVEGDMPDTIVIPANAGSVSMTIHAVANTQNIAGALQASFTLRASNAYNIGSPNSATINLLSDGPPPVPLVSVTASDSSMRIGDANDTGTFTFTRSAVSSSALTVNFTLGGSAVANTDYQTAQGGNVPASVTIPANVASQTLVLKAIANSTSANPHNTTVTVTDAAAYDLGSPNTASITILPAITGPVVKVTATDNLATYGSATDTAEFTISRATATSSALVVHYTLGGSAVAGTDYHVAPVGDTATTATIPADQTFVKLTVSATTGNAVKNATLTIAADAAYNVGSPGAASVSLVPENFNPPSTGSNVDYTASVLPYPGETLLRVLTPNILELKVINSLNPDEIQATAAGSTGPISLLRPWGEFVTEQLGNDLAPFVYQLPTASEAQAKIEIWVNGTKQNNAAPTVMAFKRRPLYAPLVQPDLRIENSLFLKLAISIGDTDTVEVKTSGTSPLWPASLTFKAEGSPSRYLQYSPAIHVNQEGYVSTLTIGGQVSNAPKQATVGFNVGLMNKELNQHHGDLELPGTEFFIVRLDAAGNGQKVWPLSGNATLVQNPEKGFPADHAFYSIDNDRTDQTPPTAGDPPYQKVYTADFTAFAPPDSPFYLYKLVVPGLGASLPFMINNGLVMEFKRTYALGLYHQRCGVPTELPYTRFVHAACHTAPAEVPYTIDSQWHPYESSWVLLAGEAQPVAPADQEYFPAQTGPISATRVWNSTLNQFDVGTVNLLYPYPIGRLEGSNYVGGFTANAATTYNQSNYQFSRNLVTVNVTGGHHDAGDYSKYMTNCADLVHHLLLTADLDRVRGTEAFNLGTPNLPDPQNPTTPRAIPMPLQEAYWEAEFISKMQNPENGGFYFLVYPKGHAYEHELPDHSQTTDTGKQIVWPVNTVSTASAVGALAQCASSPAFRHYYPDQAARYGAQAEIGWKFLENQTTGRLVGPQDYQKMTFYGDTWLHQDEVAWAACELYLYELEKTTPDMARARHYRTRMIQMLGYQKTDQADPDQAGYNPNAWMAHAVDNINTDDFNTRKWGWWKLYAKWGNTLRSLAFADVFHSGKLTEGELNTPDAALPAGTADPAWAVWDAAQKEVLRAGDVVARWSNGDLQNAYGGSVPFEGRRTLAQGWYFSMDQAAEIAVAYELLDLRSTRFATFFPNTTPVAKLATWREALFHNLNYEAGNNPVNVSFLTGLGQRRQREIVHQYAQNDLKVLPPSGVPLGSVNSEFEGYFYGSTLRRLPVPADSYNYYPDHSDALPTPLNDRWSDTYNTRTEFITIQVARSLFSASVMSRWTDTVSAPWDPTTATLKINDQADNEVSATVGTPTTLNVTSGLDLTGARVVWEVYDEEPHIYTNLAATDTGYSYKPLYAGDRKVEVEVTLPDGRRLSAIGALRVSNANHVDTVWMDDHTPGFAALNYPPWEPAAPAFADPWTWVNSSPAPFAGRMAHQSRLADAGVKHEQWFILPSADGRLHVGAGDILYVYIYIQPGEEPSEVMLGWRTSDGNYHRAFWGADTLAEDNRHAISASIPATGIWVRLEAPASTLGVENMDVDGLRFTLIGGRATWDTAGTIHPAP